MPQNVYNLKGIRIDTAKCYCHNEGGSKRKNIVDEENRINKGIKILIDNSRSISITSCRNYFALPPPLSLDSLFFL